MRRFPYSIGTVAALCLLIAGCRDESEQPAQTQADPPVPTAEAHETLSTEDVRRALGIGDDGILTKVGGQVRIARIPGTNVMDLSPLSGLPLQELDIRNTRVSDLTPLQGMPLVRFYAEGTPITDLTPLRGAPLEELYLTDTPVADLTPLAGMPFQQLNLVGTQVADLEPISTMPSIGILWLRDTPVSDLSPLKDVPITSLDIQETSVSDLSPLSGKLELRRLNIADTEVTDLWPLTNLQLSRLIFTPANIDTGIEAVRNMSSLSQLGTQFEVQTDALPAAEFWQRYDAGEFAASENPAPTE